MKKIILVLAISLLAAATAFAAKGKVKSTADGSVVVELSGDAKMKKGDIMLNGKAGKITAVEGKNITIKSKAAAGLKAGDSVKIDKASSMQGC